MTKTQFSSCDATQTCNSTSYTPDQIRRTCLTHVNKGGKFLKKLWCCVVWNRPFAGSGHMVQNKLHWDANDAVGLSKQRNSYQSSPTSLCFESPTALFAFQCNLFCTMWPDPAKGLLARVCRDSKTDVSSVSPSSERIVLNVSFRISLWWPIHINNQADKSKLCCLIYRYCHPVRIMWWFIWEVTIHFSCIQLQSRLQCVKQQLQCDVLVDTFIRLRQININLWEVDTRWWTTLHNISIATSIWFSTPISLTCTPGLTSTLVNLNSTTVDLS